MAWLSGWTHRKLKALVGSVAGDQTDYPTLTLRVHKGSGTDTGSGSNDALQHIYAGDNVRDDLGDARFTKADGQTLLDYWSMWSVSNPNKFEDFRKYYRNYFSSIPQYSGSGVVHPDVLYFSTAKDGYEYWMVYTPYPTVIHENPSIVRSNDGVAWVDTGISNPVIAKGVGGAWNADANSDPDMLYIEEYSKWFMVWGGRTAATGGIYRIALAYSSDGKSWTEYDGVTINGNTDPVILSGTDTGGVAWETRGGISGVIYPTLIYRAGTFYLYYGSLPVGDAGNRGKVGYATFTWNNSTDDVENFQRYASNPIIDLSVSANFKAGCGHMDISYYDGTFYMYVLREKLASLNYEMVLLTSTDKNNWIDQGIVLELGDSGWDSLYVYRGGPATDGKGTVVLFDGDIIKLFYSGYVSGTPAIPRIGLAVGGENFTDFMIKMDDLPEIGINIYIYYGKSDATTLSDHLATTSPSDDGVTGNFDEDTKGDATWSHVGGKYKYTEDSIDDACAAGSIIADWTKATAIKRLEPFVGNPASTDQMMFGLFDEDVVNQLCGTSGTVAGKRRFVCSRYSRNSTAYANHIVISYWDAGGTEHTWDGSAWEHATIRHSTYAVPVEVKIWTASNTLYMDVLYEDGTSVFSNPASIAIASVKAFSSGKCLALVDLYTNAYYATGELLAYFVRKLADPEPTWGDTGNEETGPGARGAFEDVYAICQNLVGISEQGEFLVGDIGIRLGKHKVLLSEHPSLQLGQGIIDTRTQTGSSMVKTTERAQDVRRPITSWPFEANAYNLGLYLCLLFQNGVSETTKKKTIGKYSSLSCEIWSTLLRVLGDGELSHRLSGAIVRNITLSTEESSPLRGTVEFIGRDLETDFDDQSCVLNMSEREPLLWQDAEVYLGGDKVHLPVFNMEISNNAFSKFFNTQLTTAHLLGDLGIAGSFRLPWDSGAAAQDANVQINDFIAGNDKLLNIYWGHNLIGDLVAGDLSIKVNIVYTGADLATPDEIVTECPFKMVNDNVNSPVEILVHDDTDRSIP